MVSSDKVKELLTITGDAFARVWYAHFISQQETSNVGYQYDVVLRWAALVFYLVDLTSLPSTVPVACCDSDSSNDVYCKKCSGSNFRMALLPWREETSTAIRNYHSPGTVTNILTQTHTTEIYVYTIFGVVLIIRVCIFV